MSTILRRQILRKCGGMDIPLVGFAPADRWNDPPFEPWVPEAFRPASLFPGTKTVIVIGFPVSLPIVDTAPSIWYHECTGRLMPSWTPAAIASPHSLPGKAILRSGYPGTGTGLSVSLKRIQSRSSRIVMRHSVPAWELRSQQYASLPAVRPRVRFTSILTTAELPADPVLKEPLCIQFRRCVRVCPVAAIPEGGYPQESTDKIACATRSEELHRRYSFPVRVLYQGLPGRERPGTVRPGGYADVR